jgi:hypothetical protein
MWNGTNALFATVTQGAAAEVFVACIVLIIPT